ncbi:MULTISPECIES: signal peptidase I [Microbacterium]|uniref:Signal peptidase I n=1 Tax=Microbacterium paraoxydans TaxID=199592 RepID=A0ABZ2HUE7_9MICO|nr:MULTISPECIES: signal peptidase I [Microbacterium]AMG84428.1 S26 family signal peptidase [Microbacterium sp. PAMC 28756]KYJ99230.1 S26 family signal peptidase [Microbacterium sp. CH1]MCT1394263.1 signal peptidase I [Microbacterium sp. p3-SID338]MPT13911.1 signal peptidase I [Microbacterium sp.]OSP00084.1 S26 family signal peptidase [Microbacterium sp. LEMMJ01]
MTDSPSARPTRRRRGFLVFLRDVLVIVVIAALVSFVIKTFVVRSFYIPSASMERTLLIDDRILVDELTPRWTGYERGDIVVFKDPGGWLDPMPQAPAQPPLVKAVDWVLTFVGISATDTQDHLVKRVIGVEGDHVVCCNALGQITINGAPIDELSYLNLPEGDTAASNEPFDVVVPEDSVWLLGDNRDRSRDARAHQELPSGGFVPVSNIVGKAFLTTWPLDRFGPIDGHHDIFTGVPDPE